MGVGFPTGGLPRGCAIADGPWSLGASKDRDCRPRGGGMHLVHTPSQTFHVFLAARRPGASWCRTRYMGWAAGVWLRHATFLLPGNMHIPWIPASVTVSCFHLCKAPSPESPSHMSCHTQVRDLQIRWADLTLHGPVGEGGFGTVFKATWMVGVIRLVHACPNLSLVSIGWGLKTSYAGIFQTDGPPCFHPKLALR